MDSAACSLLSHIEQELCALRAQSVRNLEQKVAEREEQLGAVSRQLLQLQADFQYNLQLLDNRDAELGQYDARVDALTALLQEKQHEAERFQKAATDAQKELEREKEIMEAASAAWQEHHEQLLQENSQMRRACEENMQRLHQELEQHNIALRVECERCVAEARQAACAAQERAGRAEAESQAAAAAAQRSAAQIQALQSSLQQATEECVAGRLQQEEQERTHQVHVAQLEQEKHSVGRTHQAAIDGFRAEISRLQQSLEEERRKAAEEMQSEAQQHATVVSKLQRDLESKSVLRACAGECKWLTAHNAEVSEKLEAATRLLRQWEERLRPEHDAEIARLHQELADLDRRHSTALQAAEEGRKGAEAEAASLRKEVKLLRSSLMERDAELSIMKDDRGALAAKDAELAQLRADVANLRESLRAKGNAAADWRPQQDALQTEILKLKAAVKAAEDEKQRLCAALATLRADMESMSLAVGQTSAPDAFRQPGAVAELERQLAASQRDVRRLSEENERLMEISNELRTERHRAARTATQRLASHTGPEQRAPVPATVNPYRPQYHNAIVASPSMFAPHNGPAASLLQTYLDPLSGSLHYIMAPQYPAGALAFPQQSLVPQHHLAMQHSASDLRNGTQGAESSTAEKDKGDDGYEIATRLRRIEALAEEIARAQATGISNRQRIANQRIALNQESAAAKEKEALNNGMGLVGANVGHNNVLPNMAAASLRSTPSQRERLRAIQQRGSAPKGPKVRNWNIVEDHGAYS